MLKNLVVGRNYYFRITIPQNPQDTPSYIIESNFSGTSYRVNGGAWQTYSGSFNFAWSNTANGYRYFDGTWHALSVGDVIEFTGTFTFTTSTSYTFLVDLLKVSGIDNPVKIVLYNNLSEKNALLKDLINRTTIYGALREDIDLLNPSILFEFDSVPEFNYAYLENFKRSYFITRVTCVRTNLYRLDMRVDVLGTYGDDIVSQNVLITRTSAKTNLYLVDERLPVNDIPKITYTIKNSGTLKNTDLVSYTTGWNTLKSIAVMVVNDTSPYDGTDVYYSAPTGSGLPDIACKIGDNPMAINYVLDYSQYVALCDKVKSTSSLESYVISVVAFPFDLSVIDSQHRSSTPNDFYTKPLRVNTTDIKDSSDVVIQAQISKGESSGYHVLYDGILYPINYQNEKYFLNLEPYSQVDLFIPYHGWVKLNVADIVNNRILIYFIVDLTSGDGQVYVYNYTQQKIVYSANAQIGIKLALTRTNMEELTKQKQANTTNLALGLVGSSVGVIGGIASQNYVGAVMSGIGMISSIANFVNKNAMMIPRASGTINGDKLGLYGGNVPILKLSYREPINVLGTYARLNGYPINEYGKMEDYAQLGEEEYFEIGVIHYYPITRTYITDSEINEIESLVKSGIIV